MLRTTRRHRKPRVQSGSKVDDGDKIEIKILDWLEQPDAELEPIMDLVGMGDGSFGSCREDHRRPILHSRGRNPTQQSPPKKEPKNGKH